MKQDDTSVVLAGRCPDARLRRRTAAALWLLLSLFVLRVAGQALVAFVHVTFLPPMEQWYSGLLAYPILLPVQCVIIGVFAAVCIELSTGSGFFAVPNRPWGKVLTWLAVPYFASMVARYVITMWLHPERRWFGSGTIPIAFHLVLAAYLFILGRYHTRAAIDQPAPQRAGVLARVEFNGGDLDAHRS